MLILMIPSQWKPGPHTLVRNYKMRQRYIGSIIGFKRLEVAHRVIICDADSLEEAYGIFIKHAKKLMPNYYGHDATVEVLDGIIKNLNSLNEVGSDENS